MIDVNRHKKIFGEGFDYPERKNVWQLRSNTIKISSNELENSLRGKYQKVERLNWYKDAFVVETEKNLSKSLEHILGYFFLQNLSSMIPPLVLEPREGEIILDIAASPGSKTTQMAQLMNDSGVIIANDITHLRMKALRGNLQRCGVMNTIVTQMDGKKFFRTDLKFDKILLDAPCTGTGTLNPRILKTTSERGIRNLSNTQKQLLSSASKMLNEEGVLVYSTCSLEPEENEENIDYVVRKLGLVTEKINLNVSNRVNSLTDWNNKKFDDSVANALRITPDGIMEGFFVCKLRKC